MGEPERMVMGHPGNSCHHQPSRDATSYVPWLQGKESVNRILPNYFLRLVANLDEGVAMCTAVHRA